MSRARLHFLVLTCLFAAGCAGNRENLADTSTAAAASAATATPAPGTAVQPGPAAEDASTTPTVVDGNQLAARAASTPICRNVLRRGSNVQVTECRTAEQWRLYERAEAQAAGALVRRMQGFPGSPSLR